MDEVTQQLLAELRAGLAEVFGSRLKAVHVYGSYARGEAGPHSDLDVLIVVDRIDHYAADVDASGYLVSELSLKYGISLSRVFVSEADWRDGRTPFLASARREAVPL